MHGQAPGLQTNHTSDLTGSNAAGLIVRDAYPVSPGHTLIIPRRHVGSFFDLAPEDP